MRCVFDFSAFIPPSADRPLGEDAGPRIDVDSLQLSIDPKLDRLIGAELRASLDQSLNWMVVENQPDGFTIGRLERAAAEIPPGMECPLAWGLGHLARLTAARGNSAAYPA